MRWMMGPILFLAASLTAFSGEDRDVATEFEAIEKGYEAALQSFFKPLSDAKTEEEQAKVALDWTKHPLKEWLPKAQALAEKAKGTEDAVPVLVWILTHSAETGDPPKDIHEATLRALLESHLSSPLLERVPEPLHYYCTWTLGRPRVEEALATILEKSPHAPVRAAALYHAAVLLTEDPESTEDDRARAKGLFDRLAKEFADTAWAKRASGFVFDLENLQIGKTAPDFEAADVEGAKFKLSDFRGKVVVVKFWGFW